VAGACSDLRHLSDLDDPDLLPRVIDLSPLPSYFLSFLVSRLPLPLSVAPLPRGHPVKSFLLTFVNINTFKKAVVSGRLHGYVFTVDQPFYLCTFLFSTRRSVVPFSPPCEDQHSSLERRSFDFRTFSPLTCFRGIISGAIRLLS